MGENKECRADALACARHDYIFEWAHQIPLKSCCIGKIDAPQKTPCGRDLNLNSRLFRKQYIEKHLLL